MKAKLFLGLIFVLLPMMSMAKTEEFFDFISPFNEDLAAVKKDSKWGFINKHGDIVIDFRNDLVLSKMGDKYYPVFRSGRCLIQQKKKGITYFGYIDNMGENVIPAKFLNARNFNNNRAMALELIKETAGKNDLLDKNVVYYKYFEVVIDTNGQILSYLNEKGTNVVLDKEFLKEPPKFQYKIISDNLVAYIGDNNKWMVKKINQ